MALNFPPVDETQPNPNDGQIWTAPNGRQWMFDESVPAWRSLAATGNSNIIYRGGIDLTVDPATQYTTIESGNQFAVTKGASPVNSSLYPGIGGDTVLAGTVVMYDGAEWQSLSNLPTATVNAPGVVQLAVCAEAEEGTNNTKSLTPASGKCLYSQASIGEVGITRYASRNETNAGIEAEAAVTPYSIKLLIDKINATVDNLVPTGMIMWWSDDRNIPSGWMICDGSSISNSGVTAKLYNTLRSFGTTWGSGSDVKIPDLRGRFIRGYNHGSGRDPADPPFGRYEGDTVEAHNHTINDPGHSHRVTGYKAGSGTNQPDDRVIVDDDYISSNSQSDINGTNTKQTGIDKTELNGDSEETRPKNINLTPLIKL